MWNRKWLVVMKELEECKRQHSLLTLANLKKSERLIKADQNYLVQNVSSAKAEKLCSREESFISWGLLWWCDSGMCVGVCIGFCVLGAGGLIALYTYFSFPGFSSLSYPFLLWHLMLSYHKPLQDSVYYSSYSWL